MPNRALRAVLTVSLVVTALLLATLIPPSSLYPTNHPYTDSGLSTFYSWELLTAQPADGHCDLQPQSINLTTAPDRPYKVMFVLPIPDWAAINCSFGLKRLDGTRPPGLRLGSSRYGTGDSFLAGVSGLPAERLIVALPIGQYVITIAGRISSVVVVVADVTIPPVAPLST